MPEFIKLVDESLAVKGRNLVINSKDLEFDHTALEQQLSIEIRRFISVTKKSHGHPHLKMSTTQRRQYE